MTESEADEIRSRLGEYPFGELRDLGIISGDYTLAAFPVGVVVPVAVSIGSSNRTLKLPNGGRYFVVSGAGEEMKYSKSGVHSGGAVLATAIKVNNYGNESIYPATLYGFVLRIS